MPCLVAKAAQMLQPARFGHDTGDIAHDRLDHDGGNFVAIALHRGFYHLKVVIGQRDHIVADGVGHAFGAFDTARHCARAELFDIDVWRAVHHIVIVAVILPLELDEAFAACVGAGNAQRVHGGFGARVGKAHLVHACHARKAFGNLDFPGSCEGKGGAILNGFADFARHFGVGMAQDDGAKAKAIVDEAVVVGVPNVGALPAGDDRGTVVAPIAEVGIDTIGDILLRLVKQLACFTTGCC